MLRLVYVYVIMISLILSNQVGECEMVLSDL